MTKDSLVVYSCPVGGIVWYDYLGWRWSYHPFSPCLIIFTICCCFLALIVLSTECIFSLLIWCIINKFREKKIFHHVKNEGKTNKDRQHPNFFLWGKYGVSIQTFCYQSPKPNNKKNHERGTKYSLTHWITLWMRKKWGEGRDEFLCSITLQLGATNRDEFHMSVIQPHSIILRMNHFRSKKLHTKISITSH